MSTVLKEIKDNIITKASVLTKQAPDQAEKSKTSVKI
jgi:hypothetical protein